MFLYAGQQPGVSVKPAVRDPETGKVTLGEAFQHLIMLAGVFADSPACAKLMYTVASWTAFFVCPFCKLMGTACDNVVRYLGYAKPSPVTKGPDQGASFQMGVNDGAWHVTSEDNKLRGLVEHVQYSAGGWQAPSLVVTRHQSKHNGMGHNRMHRVAVKALHLGVFPEALLTLNLQLGWLCGSMTDEEPEVLLVGNTFGVSGYCWYVLSSVSNKLVECVCLTVLGVLYWLALCTSLLHCFVPGIAHDGHSAIKGYRALLRSLHYVDFNCVWIVPFCHAFFLGIFKDFLDAIFAKKAAGTAEVSYVARSSVKMAGCLVHW